MKFAKRSHALLFTTLLLLFSSAPAQSFASSGWRYWGYFQAKPGTQTWSYALTGPTSVVPDGSVEGWAFTFSGDDVPDAAAPKISADFTKICGATRPVAGKKRIGLVVDFGSAILRPRGEFLPRSFSRCIVIEKSATGVDILNSSVKVRYASSGYVCGINSYPERECGVEIKTPRIFTKK